MTWPYGSVAGFFTRFPKTSVTTAEVNSFFLYDASAWLDERLCRAFTVPFSSNNFTAERLTYLKALHLIRVRTAGPSGKAEAQVIADEIQQAVNQLLAGSAYMLQIDPALGPVPLAADLTMAPGEQGHIVTGDGAYAATFGLDSPLTNFPDNNRIDDTVLGRPDNRPSWQDDL